MDIDQDIDTNRVTVPELDFKSPFVLKPVSTSDSSSSGAPTKMRAFLTWFDTFFSPDASTAGQAALGRDTQYVVYDEDAYRRPVGVRKQKTDELAIGGEGEGLNGGNGGKEISFTTGPRGKATHWKQVAFMLKEPVEVPAGESRISELRKRRPCLLCFEIKSAGRAMTKTKMKKGDELCCACNLSLIRACQRKFWG